MTIHELKTTSEHFAHLREGVKLVEIRKNDRNPPFKVGDLLVLKEWIERFRQKARFSGQIELRLVTHVLYLTRVPGEKFPEGYAAPSSRRPPMPSEVKPWYASTRYYRMPRWPWRFRSRTTSTSALNAGARSADQHSPYWSSYDVPASCRSGRGL
jgi:hypothetical protein